MPSDNALKAFEEFCLETKQDNSEQACEMCGSLPGRPSEFQALCGKCNFTEPPEGRLSASKEFALTDSTESFTPPPLYGDHTPAVLLQREQTGHRAICYLAAQGMSNVEIAEMMGCTAVKVAYVKKQPHSLELINQLQDQFGRKNVMKILAGAATNAAKTLVALAEGTIENTKPADRGKAAKEILDRMYGTAPQVQLHGKLDASEMTDEELVQTLKTQG